jgi:hypothetical protein
MTTDDSGLTSSLFGRTTDLRLVRSMVERATVMSAKLALSAPAGWGKTALLTAAAEHARSIGTEVVWLSGAEFEQDPSVDRLIPAARKQAILLIVDDLRRVDREGRSQLERAAAGLGQHRIGLLVATRENVGHLADIPVHTLAPLNNAAAILFLMARFPAMAVAVRTQLVDAARGSPLALAELPLALTDGQRNGTEPLPDGPWQIVAHGGSLAE